MPYAIEVKPTLNKGRGVFAKKHFYSGEIIEICPVVLITNKEYALLEKTILDNYMYSWPEKSHQTSLPLGFGLIYNHSYHPNASFEFDTSTNTIVYHAISDIQTGQEILINYNQDPKDLTPLDFQDVHYGGPMIVKE